MMLYFLHHSLSFNNPTLPVSNLGIRRFVNIMLRPLYYSGVFKKTVCGKIIKFPPAATTIPPTLPIRGVDPIRRHDNARTAA
jgi:hypothetical protein